MYRSIFFLTSALVGGEWSASRPGRFTPRESSPGTHQTRGWVGPRTGLNDMEKRKFLPLPGLELRPIGRPAHSQSLYRLSCPGLLHFNNRRVIARRPGLPRSPIPSGFSVCNKCSCFIKVNAKVLSSIDVISSICSASAILKIPLNYTASVTSTVSFDGIHIADKSTIIPLKPSGY
jgi:hypothetical protein